MSKTVPKSLIEVFMKLRPDLLPIEFNEQICCDILENILNKKKDDSHLMTEKEQKLSARVTLLQEELRLALLASEDIKALKAKAVHIMEQFSRQKEQRHEAEAKKDAAEKRTGMLVAHIEKLMKCLNMEAAKFIKSVESNQRERKLTFKLTQKLAEKDAKISHQNRLIVELKEGAHVLEGQLRLMDERFFELRQKLDAARSNQKYYVEKAQKTALDLRKKFAVIHGPRYKLDDVVVPELPQMNENIHPNLYQRTNIITEFDTPGMLGESSLMDGAGETSNIKAQGKLRPGTAAALRSSHQFAATDPHQKLQENMELRRSASARPSTAPHARPQSAGATRLLKSKTSSERANENKDAQVDKIITRIYSKHSDKKLLRWTPDALANLVRDETGKVTCPIPNLEDTIASS